MSTMRYALLPDNAFEDQVDSPFSICSVVCVGLGISLWDAALLGAGHRNGIEGDEDPIFDVCIIGSGASGAVVADCLVRRGADVLMIETGGRLRAGASNAELDRTCEGAFARDDAGRWTARGWPWTTSNLGGGTVFYGGASFRYTELDFDPSAEIRVDDLDVRWPFGGEALRPYYQEIERRLAVSGADRSLPGEYLWRGAVALGYDPISTPLAIDQARCSRDSLCISHPCDRGAKRDAVGVFLAPLASARNFTLRTFVKAVALEQRRARDVESVRCIDVRSGRSRSFRARRFVLACNAVQSAALLLRSQTRWAPSGIGNAHDMVGRGLCMKLSEYTTGAVAVAPGEIDRHPVGYRGPFSTMSILGHYRDPACPTGVGGLIYEAKHDAVDRLRSDALVLRVETIVSDHPSRANRVRLARTRDRWGVPKIALDYRIDARDRARLAYMVGRCRRLMQACGARDIATEASNSTLGSTHLHGTCRAGTDPEGSVVDPMGRVHTVENVFVADGGFMPYPGGLNPTLTIQANALRIAEHLAV
jgi:choline dehydrogenase-like flavoprotein